jgi:hypothetical protein
MLMCFAYLNTGSIPIHSTQLFGSDQNPSLFFCPLFGLGGLTSGPKPLRWGNRKL